VGSEVNKDPVSAQDRRRRGVAVLRVDLSRVLLLEDLDIAQDPPIFPMKAEGAQGVAIIERGREPDLIALDNR
jgi:hypothetical protein